MSEWQDGATPLHVACEKGHAAVVRYLAGLKDVDVNTDDSVRSGPSFPHSTVLQSVPQVNQSGFLAGI